MARRFVLHPDNPQPRLIGQVADLLRAGEVIVYPTDSAYALGCLPANKAGLEKIRRIRQLDKHHNFTLVCRDLSELSRYARVDNSAYRLLKHYTPGAYTFILRASQEVPRLMMHPKRKTIGLRVPDHPVISALLEAIDEPLLSTTLHMPGDQDGVIDLDEVEAAIGHEVAAILDCGWCSGLPTTVVDLTEGAPQVMRRGKADPEPFL